MKGRIGKYKDKIVVWGDPNLTAKNEINIDSLGGEGESQTGDSDSMNYYILKEDLDFSLSSEDFRTEVYNKTKDKTIPALINSTEDPLVTVERFRSSFLDVKCIGEGHEIDPLSSILEVYLSLLYELQYLYDISSDQYNLLLMTNNNRYIHVAILKSRVEIGGVLPITNNIPNGILCFSTPKVVPMCFTNNTTYITGQLINPIEALYDEEILNTWFKKVSFAEYNEFTKKVLLKAFG